MKTYIENRLQSGNIETSAYFDALKISGMDISQSASALGKKGGKATSKAKAEAARANGKKGGRPKSTNGDSQDNANNNS